MTNRPEAAPMAEPWASRTPCAPRRPNPAAIGTWTAYDWDTEACFVYRDGLDQLDQLADAYPRDVADKHAALARASFCAARTAATIANGLRR